MSEESHSLVDSNKPRDESGNQEMSNTDALYDKTESSHEKTDFLQDGKTIQFNSKTTSLTDVTDNNPGGLEAEGLGGLEADTRCGLLGCRPLFLQNFAKVACFTPVYGFAGLVTSTLSVYVNSQVTTLERQFGFSSNQTGLIMAANDIGFLVFVLFVSYLAPKMHIPKSLGVMTIVFGISGLMCCLPHFFFGSQLNLSPTAGSLSNTSSVVAKRQRAQLFGDLCVPGQNSSELCSDIKDSSEYLSEQQNKKDIALYSLVIIFVGMMIQGLGKAPRTAYVITYVDDNTRKVKTGFYMGVIIAMGIFGPAIAFTFGGLFSRMYVTLEATSLSPKHPRWIGAWWLGYMLFGFIALVVSVPLFCFPRRLHRSKARQTEDANEFEKKSGNELLKFTSGAKSTNKSGVQNHSVWWYFKDFLATSYRLWTNPVYVCITLAACCILFMVAGLSAYSPKYIENMFDLPTSTVNYIMAGNTLFTSCLGTFIGGYLSKRLKMTAWSALRFICVVQVLSVAASLAGLAFYCDQPEVVGGPGSSCDDNCACADNSYFPICGEDGRTYYSPCYAGCVTHANGTYTNCTCIPGGGAVSGTCDYSCDSIYLYVAALGLRSLIATTWIIPKMIIMIRCVSEKDKTLALGFYAFSTSLLGWMLGPIVFGNFIDEVCDVWDVTCVGRGRCLRYDNDSFRVKLHGYTSLALTAALAFIIFAYIYARRTGCLSDKTEPLGDKTGTSGGKENKEDNSPIYKPRSNRGKDKGRAK